MALGRPCLLFVDTPFILPINVQIMLLITSADVLHSFAIPSFGIKMDACPGRLNATTFVILRDGIYFGQCSELCGVNHAYMPIMVTAVNYADFYVQMKRIVVEQN